ncbi:MAG: class I SAM-dependent methyltransferase [Pseudomonadota bacterium]
MDRETIAFYSDQASDYAEFVGDSAQSAELTRFIQALTPGATALDFGCGHGWAAAGMRDAGFEVTAIDASAGFVAEAKARYGIDVDVMTFDRFEAEAAFDGLWVSFSLLHDPRAALLGHLTRLRRAARPNALLYLGLKEGEGEQRDTHGRLYTYFGEDELRDALAKTGWGEIDLTRVMLKGMAGSDEPCLHIFARAI